MLTDPKRMIHHLDLSSPKLTHIPLPDRKNTKNIERVLRGGEFMDNPDYLVMEGKPYTADYFHLLYKYSKTSSCENLLHPPPDFPVSEQKPRKKSGLLPRILPSWLRRKKKSDDGGHYRVNNFLQPYPTGSPYVAVEAIQPRARSHTVSDANNLNRMVALEPKLAPEGYSRLQAGVINEPRTRDASTNTRHSPRGGAAPADCCLTPLSLKGNFSCITGGSEMYENSPIVSRAANAQVPFYSTDPLCPKMDSRTGNGNPNNQSSSSSTPEHKSSGYATLDTTNSALPNQMQSPRQPEPSRVNSPFRVPAQPPAYYPRERRKPPRVPMTSNPPTIHQKNPAPQTPPYIPATNPNFRSRRPSNGSFCNSPKSPVVGAKSGNHFEFESSTEGTRKEPEYRPLSSERRAPDGKESAPIQESLPTYRLDRRRNHSAQPSPLFTRSQTYATSQQMQDTLIASSRQSDLRTSLDVHRSVDTTRASQSRSPSVDAQLSRRARPGEDHDYSTIGSRVNQRPILISRPLPDRPQRSAQSSSRDPAQTERESQKAILNKFFDSQGTSERVLRQFQKQELSGSITVDLGSIPSLVTEESRPAGSFTQQDLATLQYYNPALTEPEKTALVVNWLMHCQIEHKPVCFF